MSEYRKGDVVTAVITGRVDTVDSEGRYVNIVYPNIFGGISCAAEVSVQHIRLLSTSVSDEKFRDLLGRLRTYVTHSSLGVEP